ncbi:MAG: hypothetical protein ABIM58_01065 [candidate division WOR-3 bacterium]
MFDADSIKKALMNILEKELEEENIYLLDLEVKGTGRKFRIVLTIDKKNGITAKDTEKWAERLINILKVEGIYIEPEIEVTSPGLNRELKSEREYLWAKGKRIKIITKDREFKGHLLDFKENLFYIVIGKNLIKIPVEEVKKIKLCEMEEI